MSLSRLAELRACRALAAARVNPADLRSLESVTNEVWSTPTAVVRVNRKLVGRLRREAMLAPRLPAALGYPEILASGMDQGQDWLVSKRRPGIALVRAWPGMVTAERRDAVAKLAELVGVLHHTRFPLDVPTLEDPPQLLQPGPRATEPLLAGLDRCRDLPNIDRGAIDELIAWVRANRAVLDPFEAPTFIHGDLHFQNILWDGERITAMLDFEFARPAPPDLDLDVFLRFCAFPYLFVPVGRETEATADEYAEVPWWFAEHAPYLFGTPRALDRLRLYAIAFDVKQVLESPPVKRANDLTRHHPYRRLLLTLRGASHLDALDQGVNKLL